ncbi:hypothetical protein A8C56_03875 [Niabella ginsenosidivorans]|uniref:Uncharacterized protein n=1 Tax=Niabella ginsenosidivorans TaxID=1176587 RepID=A0A1A9I101_9BACT|nr:hypothetical protein [Niabella ginsenosidivorans]ANH80234.1 hypothetical protein A8C56_03875 [Niabella ginsenosidivorans]
MKQTSILVILIFYFFASGYAQVAFKVINGITKQPVKEETCSIIKDGDALADIDVTDSLGVFTPRIVPDSNATYQLWIDAEGFRSLKKEIDLRSNKVYTIFIFPDKKAIQKIPGYSYGGCSTVEFGDYEPGTPESLTDLPDSIREKLEKHLLNRLGKKFYSKLKLNGGQIVDLDRLYIVNPRARYYQWVPYSYYLCFSFQAPEKGIGLYTAKIVLDKNGNIAKEIELPDISSHPEKANIIARKSALLIAKKSGFTEKTGKITLDYSSDAGSLTWCFERTIKDNGLTFVRETLKIDAHNGKVLGISNSHGIR